MSSTVVLLHAMGASRRMWRAQLDALGSRYELIAPDLPGHGHAPGPFTLDAAVDSVRDVLADTASSGAFLVGASLGGAVALRVAYAEPDRVAGLVLIGTPVRSPGVSSWVQRMVTAVLPIASTAATSARLVRPADTRDAEALADDIVRAGKQTQGQALRALARSDPGPWLSEVAVPTLVCCGSEDRANLPSARVLAAQLPNATLRIVHGGGHLWTLQQPGLCTEVVDEFVRSHASPAGR